MVQVNLDTSSELTLEATLTSALAETLDTPRALTVALLIKYEEWRQLIGLRCDAENYQDIGNFADDYLISNILRKSPNLPLGVDRRAKAVEAFVASETRCKSANDRLLKEEEPVWMHHFRSVIYRILGPLTASDVQFVQNNMRFGPGATTGVQGVGSCASDKIIAEMHLTEKLIPFYKAILEGRWWEHQRNPVVVKGGEFFTVPKDAEIDRGCCKGATLNLYCQLAYGALVRQKLQNFGLDLNVQAETNRFLASKAQDWGLVTIDLRDASNSVCWALPFKTFPHRWFEMMELFREDFALIPDLPDLKTSSYQELEKLSSMGNGFTFEVESLLFYALALTVVPKEKWNLVTVFGDDIILPKEYSSVYIERLTTLGFEVNSSKTFLAGRFFESCGTDWFDGVDVRPFFLKGSNDPDSDIEGVPYQLRIANKLRIYAARRGCGLGADRRFLKVYKALKAVIPTPWNSTKVPLSEGDNGIITAYSETKRLKRLTGFEDMFVGTSVKVKPVYREYRNPWRLIYLFLQKANVGRGEIYNLNCITPDREPERLTFPYRTWPKADNPRRYNPKPQYLIELRKLQEVRWSWLKEKNVNKEPIRGYLGRAVSEQRPMYWVEDGLTWL